MIPLRDDIPTKSFPFITVLLIAANIAVFFTQLSQGAGGGEFVHTLGVVPVEITRGIDSGTGREVTPELTLFTSMFLHGGFLHLGGNMLFLWIFGNNVEDSTGPVRFLLFYFLAGLAAAATHIALHPDSRVPMIGASGAVSGVLGAYFLLYPRARVLTLIFFGFFLQTALVPAGFFLGFWFLLQFLSGWIGSGASSEGVAWFAHVGGFLAGIPLLLLFKKRGVRLWSRKTGWTRGYR